MASGLDPRANAAETTRGVGDASAPAPADDRTAALLPAIPSGSVALTGGHGGRPLLVEFDAENPHERPTPGVLARLALAAGADVHRTVDAFGIPSLMPGARVRLTREVAPFLVPQGPAAQAAPDVGAWSGSVQVWIGATLAVERRVS